MSKIRFCLITLALGASYAVNAADVPSAPAQDTMAEWPVVQAAGGIQVASPVSQTTTSAWKLPLTCDMSIHAPGTLIQKTLVHQEGKDIFISLILSHTVWTLTPERGQCKPVTLDADAGKHAVYYRDTAGKSYFLGFADFTLIGSGPGG